MKPKKLSKLEARIAGALYDQRFGRPMTATDIADLVWRDDISGGPEFADVCVRRAIMLMRRKLPRLGCTITNQYGTGYRLVRLGVEHIEVEA